MDALVARDSAQQGAPIEIAGLKIRRSAIGFWGIAVLLGFQIYFYSHLKELVRRSPPGPQLETGAWIVVYPGARNTLVSLVSTALIPAVAVFFAVRVLQPVTMGSAIVAASTIIASVCVFLAVVQVRFAVGRSAA